MTARPQLSEALHAAWGYDRSSQTELRAHQDASLRRLAVHAYEQVRYYHRLFDRHRLHPRHLRGVMDLDLVPVTGLEDRQGQMLPDLLAREVDSSALLPGPALASNGAAPRIYRTWLEDLLELLRRMRTLGGLGLLARDRIAVVGAGDGRAEERHGVALRLLGFRRRRYFDGSGEPGAVAEQIAEFNADVVAGTAETLQRLAGAAGDLRPRLVVVEGRPPLPRLRARLAEAFGAPVHATYGLGADTVLASECRETGAFHVSDGAVLLEVLVDGRPAAVGERGEVAITLLHSYAMPILRHRLGHRATRGGPCACGATCTTILAPDA